MDELLKYVKDPTYIVLVVIIILQQRQIMFFANMLQSYSAAMSELSTLIKMMIGKGKVND